MTVHTTFHTPDGRQVTVTNAAAPDYESPGIVWHCAGCGERSDWPLNTNSVVDDIRLTTAAATAHAIVCGSPRQQRSAAIATARRYLAAP